MKSLLAINIAACFFSAVAATETHITEADKVIPETSIERVDIKGVRGRLLAAGALKDNDIVKTEILTGEAIKGAQAGSLADAIKNAIGIRVSNECSMCGAKRIMINGMKGEHTNVLVDGIPLHTMMSGFYGMDAIAATGIGTIEIARGAGASMTAPEAMGGTINLVTQSATESSLELDISGGELGYRKASVLANGVSDDKHSSITLIGQYDHRDQYDGDHNGVSETPMMRNQSATLYASHDLSYNDNLKFRFSDVHSEVFGGPVLGDITGSIDEALDSVSLGEAAALFTNGDVRQGYIGNPWETAEWVKTGRRELSVSWLHDVNGVLNITTSAAHVEHKQDSFYEGIDYDAIDSMTYYGMRVNYDANENHLLTFGLSHRNEAMRSQSEALSALDNYMVDSFDYRTQGVYIQDNWIPSANFELSVAVRFDQIHADFIDPSKQGTEIDKFIVSPRMDMRYQHTDELTSRVSIGKGYRAPLSFFESDHGILDSGKGYLIEIDQPERSTSVNYSLNYQQASLNATLSLAVTQVQHLAMLSYNEDDVPVLRQNPQQGRVSALDAVVNYQLLEDLTIGFSAEQYDYDDAFRSTFAIAPVEQRLTMSTDWHYQGWELTGTAVWVASRDLRDYGYAGFNRNNGSSEKTYIAPSYVSIDGKLSKKMSDQLSLYIGAFNMTDSTQVNDGNSPLMYDADGGYDVVYIHGPLRGRTLFLGFDYDF